MQPIVVKGLSKTFKGKKGARIEALKGIDLSLERGEIFGFLGPNGAGKSTTIKILTGLIRPSSGEASLFERSVEDEKCRSRVGYLPENPAIFEYLNAFEYLRYVGRAHSLDADFIEKRSRDVLEMLELGSVGKRPIRFFSKGMVQRLGLAQALLPDPDLYVLDEPMSGLDPLGRSMVKSIIKDLKKSGKTVFFSTHITSDVEALCDRIAIIVNGTICALESVSDLLRRGVSGYSVRYYDVNGTFFTENVTKAILSEKLDTLISSGADIESIEPCRRDLEAYFLDVVEKGNAKT